MAGPLDRGDRPFVIHLDTHVVVWAYLGDRTRLSTSVQRVLESDALAISPIVRLEVGLLHEVGRQSDPPDLIVDRVLSGLGATVSRAPYAEVVAAALPLGWTRDPFDRLLLAAATVDRARLLTRDRLLRERAPAAFWP